MGGYNDETWSFFLGKPWGNHETWCVCFFNGGLNEDIYGNICLDIYMCDMTITNWQSVRAIMALVL